MSLSVVYTVVNGVVYSEDRGGTVTDYRPDTLGSTAALTQGNTVTATYVYWPYGEVRSKTGSGTTNFTYVGTLGYYNDTSLRSYVRARHYRQNAGRWMTVDPLWADLSIWHLLSWPGRPITSSYSYSELKPTEYRDETGLWTIKLCFMPGTLIPIPCPPISWPPGITVSTDPGKNPVDYNYGFYCGARVRCEPNEGIDCIDKACREHDTCTSKIPGFWYFWGFDAARCHCKLFADALKCAMGGCLLDHLDGPLGSILCNEAAGQVLLFFALQCKLSNPIPFV